LITPACSSRSSSSTATLACLVARPCSIVSAVPALRSLQAVNQKATVQPFDSSTFQRFRAEVVLIVSVVPNVPVVHGSESWAEKNSATRGGGLRFANCLLVYHQVDMISGAM
jgi:hypothetical protein